jgi:O-antigen ligase
MVVVNIIISNRACIILAALFIGIVLLLGYKNERTTRKVKLILGIAILLIAVFLAWTFDIFGFQTIINKTSIMQRVYTLQGSGYTDPRMERQLYIINHFFDNTTGGGYFSNVIGEPHNVWLDVYDYAGIVPFILFLMLTFKIVRSCWLLYASKENKEDMHFLFMMIIGLLAAFTYEPVMRSVESITILFFFISGVAERQSRKCKKLIKRR